MADCFRICEFQSETLNNSKLLCLHCVDMAVDISLFLKELPCLEWLALLGHVSLPERLNERRMVLLPKLTSLLSALQQSRSPVLIEVSHSFDLELEDHSPILVLWKFQEVPGVLGNSLEPKREYDGENDIPTMPWLDLQNCHCNCTNWPRKGRVLVEKNEEGETAGVAEQLQYLNIEESEEDSNEDETKETGDSGEQRAFYEPLSTETFKLKGSSFHPDMQKALRQSQGRISRKEVVLVSVFEHSANVRDENALIAKVEVAEREILEPIGYIPGRKVQKFKDALDKNEIFEIILKRVHREYIPALNNFMLFGYIQATKAGPWMPDNKYYVYNS